MPKLTELLDYFFLGGVSLESWMRNDRRHD